MNPVAAAAGNLADTWDLLDRLVEDVAQLSKSDLTPEAYAHELLRRSVDALAALGGAAWKVQADEHRLVASYVANGPASTIALPLVGPFLEPAHRQLLAWLSRRAEPLQAAPSAVVDPIANVVNSYEVALIAAPIVVDRSTVGVLELILRPDIGPDARQGALRLLCTLAECAADHHRERQRRLWQDQADTAEEFERFIADVYADLDPTSVAFVAANEGRRLAGCDRTSLLLGKTTGTSIAAVSGVDSVDQRSDHIRLLRQLVHAVTHEGEPLCYESRKRETLPHAIGNALSNYIDQTDATIVVVLPLTEPNRHKQDPQAVTPSAIRTSIGAVVFEWFTGTGALDETSRARLEKLTYHCSQAMHRALECDSIPFGRWWRRRYRRRGRFGATVRKLSISLAIAAVVIGLPFLIPAEATVEARGTLEPENRREVFAPADGIVAEIAARHGQTVAAEAPLVVLHSPPLTIELTRVAGELQTSERRLAALRATRIVAVPNDAAGRLQAQERSAEEEQFKESIRSLTEQRKLLLQQLDDLTVRASITGIVTTWDVERLLLGRPVARGQSLLELAETAGPWIVEVLVPDRLIGDVLAARRLQAEPPAVEFVSAAQPDAVHRGRLLKISESTQIDSRLGVVVKATVAFDRNDLSAAQLRPGAIVTARILCGPSSLGAVYGRDAWRLLQSWWW